MEQGLVYRTLEALERLFYRAADRIVVVTNGFRDDLVARGVPAEKVDVVFNGADPLLYDPASRERSAMRAELAGDAEILVSYVGTHGLLQGLEQILDAADALRDDARFAFAFVGEGARKAFLIEEARRRGLSRVRFVDAVPKASVPDVYAASDVCVVCLRPLPIFEKFIPSKVFETLAAGRPIVAALSGEAADIVRRAGGAVALPGDGRSIAAALVDLASKSPDERRAIGERGRRFIADTYDRRRLAREYWSVLEKTKGSPAAS
jgi:glycosyltransferase involved in cell wall biosynthesis